MARQENKTYQRTANRPGWAPPSLPPWWGAPGPSQISLVVFGLDWACGTYEGGWEEKLYTWNCILGPLSLRKPNTSMVRRRRACCTENASVFAYEDVDLHEPVLEFFTTGETTTDYYARIYLCNCHKSWSHCLNSRPPSWYFAIHCSNFLPLTSGKWLLIADIHTCWVVNKQKGI